MDDGRTCETRAYGPKCFPVAVLRTRTVFNGMGGHGQLSPTAWMFSTALAAGFHVVLNRSRLEQDDVFKLAEFLAEACIIAFLLFNDLDAVDYGRMIAPEDSANRLE